LSFGKSLFLKPEEVRVEYLLTRGQDGEGLEANVYPNLLIGGGQSERFPFAREGNVPLVCTAPPDAHGLGRALKGAVKHYLDGANFGQVEYVARKVSTVTVLRVAHAVIATLTPETGVAGRFTSLHTSEESRKCQVYSLGDILQYLAVNQLQVRALPLQGGYAGLRLIPISCTPLLLVSVFTISKGAVIQPSALLKHEAQTSGLRLCWKYAVEKGLSHICSISQVLGKLDTLPKNSLEVGSEHLLRSGGCIPMSKDRGLAAFGFAKLDSGKVL
jgi:hypothetical protein